MRDSFLQTFHEHGASLLWLTGFLINIFFAFTKQNTGVFSYNLEVAFGRIIGYAVVAFIFTRPLYFFKRSQFVDKAMPALFVFFSLIVN